MGTSAKPDDQDPATSPRPPAAGGERPAPTATETPRSSRVRRRVYELDLLRLLAALAVVAYHYTFRFQEKAGPIGVRFPAVLGAVTRYGFLGVQMFFLISGAVILRSAMGRSGRSFLAGRIGRLFPAYWAMLTITYLVRWIWGSGSLVAPPLRTYLDHLPMTQSFFGVRLIDGVYWTLARELVFYAIVWMVLALGQLRHLRAVLATWLLVSMTSAVFHPTHQSRLWLASDSTPYFVAGGACALLAASENRRDRAWNWLLGGAAVASGVWLAAGPETRRLNGAYGAGTLNAAVMGIAVVGFFVLVWAICTGRLRRVGRPWMAVAGALTYPVYLVHQIVGEILFERLPIGNRWVLLVGISAAMLALSWVVHVVVERPLTPALKRVAERLMFVPVAEGGGGSFGSKR